MVEYDRNSQRDQSKPALRPCIIGIGGAGSNVLDRITLDRTVDAHLICMHTDIRVLSHAMAPNKIQLGADLMRGCGAGGDPDLGREAALFSRDEIRQAIEGHEIIFICTGLGGGTGSGAAPVIAEIAKNTNALVFVTATMPFSFEGRRRLAQAEESLQLLQKRADALILFENNRMGELILPKDGIQKAFSQADQLIAQSLRAVSTIVSMPGLVKLGIDDLTSALSSSNGRCLFGFGEARGQNRGSEALKRALKSPLIDQGRLLHQTRTLLVHIAGGESLTLVEVDAVMKQLGKNVPDQTHILFGVAVDAKLGESLAVTLISSLGLAQLNAQATAAPPAEMLLHRPALEERAAAEAPPPQPSSARENGRSMRSVAALAAAQQAQAAAASASAASDPGALDLLFKAEAAKAAAPAAATAPSAELFADTFPAAPAASAPKPAAAPAPKVSPAPSPGMNTAAFAEPEIEAEEEEQGFVIEHQQWTQVERFDKPVHQASAPVSEPETEPELEPESEYEPETEAPWESPHAEDEYEPEPAAAPAPKHAPAPAPAAASPVRPRPIAPHEQPRPRATSLAAVVARAQAPLNASAPSDAEASYAPPQNTIVPKKTATSNEQIAFRFGEEDRGRFKDTEPALVQGEDLDVPTWMRLKRKLKK